MRQNLPLIVREPYPHDSDYTPNGSLWRLAARSDGAPFEPSVDILRPESDRAAWKPDRGDVAAPRLAQHRLRGYANDLGELASGEKPPGHPPNRSSIGSCAYQHPAEQKSPPCRADIGGRQTRFPHVWQVGGGSMIPSSMSWSTSASTASLFESCRAHSSRTGPAALSRDHDDP